MHLQHCRVAVALPDLTFGLAEDEGVTGPGYLSGCSPRTDPAPAGRRDGFQER